MAEKAAIDFVVLTSIHQFIYLLISNIYTGRSNSAKAGLNGGLYTK